MFTQVRDVMTQVSGCYTEEASNMGVRFRLYGCERMRRERMIGECVVGFASFSLDSDVTLWLTLEPRSNLSVGAV